MGRRSPQRGQTFMARCNGLQVLRAGAFHFLTDYSYLPFYGIFTSFIGKYSFLSNNENWRLLTKNCWKYIYWMSDRTDIKKVYNPVEKFNKESRARIRSIRWRPLQDQYWSESLVGSGGEQDLLDFSLAITINIHKTQTLSHQMGDHLEKSSLSRASLSTYK